MGDVAGHIANKEFVLARVGEPFAFGNGHDRTAEV